MKESLFGLTPLRKRCIGDFNCIARVILVVMVMRSLGVQKIEINLLRKGLSIIKYLLINPSRRHLSVGREE